MGAPRRMASAGARVEDRQDEAVGFVGRQNLDEAAEFGARRDGVAGIGFHPEPGGSAERAAPKRVIFAQSLARVLS